MARINTTEENIKKDILLRIHEVCKSLENKGVDLSHLYLTCVDGRDKNGSC